MTQMISITSPPVSTSAAGQGAKVKSALQDIATIFLLTLALPFNAVIVLIALTAGAIKTLFNLLGFNSERENNPTVTSASTKTVLISGAKMTKALQLARSFHRAGHRVILIETHKYWLVGHRFSNAVDKFYTVPKPGSPDYAKSLLEIVEREQVDMYVPVCSPVASYYDSQAIPQLIDHCEVMHVEPEKIELLDDKYQFAKAAESFGLAVPKSYCITNPQQVIDFDFSGESRPYILKSIPYDSVRRLDLTKLPCETPEATAAFVRSLPISEKTPWVMQEFIAGQEYCTHSTLLNGELRMHCCCESSAFQVNYENVDQPEIENWVRRFAAGLNLTGQASFDFMQANDNGKVYAIECNPRTHSAITMFYNQPMVAEAYLGNVPLPSPVQPLPESQPTYWTYHEVWRLLSGVFGLLFGLLDVFGGSGEKKSLSERKAAIAQTLNTLTKGKDAIFDWQDPLPFLMVHHWQIPLLLFDDLRQLKGWIRIDFNIGKLVQLGGD